MLLLSKSSSSFNHGVKCTRSNRKSNAECQFIVQYFTLHHLYLFFAVGQCEGQTSVADICNVLSFYILLKKKDRQNTAFQNIHTFNKEETLSPVLGKVLTTFPDLLFCFSFYFFLPYVNMSHRMSNICAVVFWWSLVVFVALQQSMAWLPSRMTVRSRSWQWVTPPQRRARASPSWAARSHRVNRICASPCSRKVLSVSLGLPQRERRPAQPLWCVWQEGKAHWRMILQIETPSNSQGPNDIVQKITMQTFFILFIHCKINALL